MLMGIRKAETGREQERPIGLFFVRFHADSTQVADKIGNYQHRPLNVGRFVEPRF
jgi:hypothetical protein